MANDAPALDEAIVLLMMATDTDRSNAGFNKHKLIYANINHSAVESINVMNDTLIFIFTIDIYLHNKAVVSFVSRSQSPMQVVLSSIPTTSLRPGALVLMKHNQPLEKQHLCTTKM